MGNHLVFLSHNSVDKPAVKNLARALQRKGLGVWYDEWNLPPGSSWLEQIENGIKESTSALVFVGASGIGRWESPERSALHSRHVRAKDRGADFPIIPVLLPGAPENPELPEFLANFQFVDLRSGITEQSILRLVWGITGKRPADLGDGPDGSDDEPVVVPTPVPITSFDDENYLDFCLRCGERTGDDFPVELISHGEVVSKSNLKWPFDERDLQSRLQMLQIELLKSVLSISGTNSREVSDVKGAESKAIQAFGGELLEALLSGPIRQKYDAQQREAKASQRGLRLRLEIRAPELAALPWEYAWDRDRNEFLCFLNTSVVRFLDGPTQCHPAPSRSTPLRILGMVARPVGFSDLKSTQEQNRIQQSLEELQSKRLVEIKWLRGGTWAELQDELNCGDWHVFHFIGHGSFDPVANEGCLILEDKNKAAFQCSATQLARIFSDHPSLRLFVLNACQSGASNPANLYSSTAALLAHRGVPAVIAMQERISDAAALLFSKNLYECLAQGHPIEKAVYEGRKAISVNLHPTVEWGTPVLYMNSVHGVLIEAPALTPPEPPPLPAPPTPIPTPQPDAAVSTKQPFQPTIAPLTDGYWSRNHLSVRVVVSCQDSRSAKKIMKFADALRVPKPVFSDSNEDLLAANLELQDTLRFAVHEVDATHLLSEIQKFLIQDEERMLIVLSDGLAQNGVDSYEPTELTRTIRQYFLKAGRYCGLIGLVPAKSARTRDIDRTLDAFTLSESSTCDAVRRVADGLRMKAPPGKGSFSETDEPVIVQLVQNEHDMEACLKLRHLIYDRMGYLEDEISQFSSHIELDYFDLFDPDRGIGAIHFLAKTYHSGEVIGTGRLILARKIADQETTELIGSPATDILNQQRAMIDRILERCDPDGALTEIMDRHGFATLPLLQSTELGKQTQKVLRDVESLSELSRLVIAPRHRGMGVSRLLVRAILTVAVDLRKAPVVLECIPAHVPMYEKYGFVAIQGTHTRAQSLDQEAIAMVFQLAEGMNRASALIENDKQMILSSGLERASSLADTGHLCACGEVNCWTSGRYGSRNMQCCGLLELHSNPNFASR